MLNKVRVWIAGFVLRRASGVRVVSERIEQRIEKVYRPRSSISVLPIFADVGRLRNMQIDPSLAARFARFSTKMLVVSRLESEKNVRFAIESFAQTVRPDSCLIIVGDGNERSALEHLVKTQGIADRVFFESEKDAAPYYGITDLVLCTSRYEGYGLVIVEALAAGKPVLSTDVGVACEAGAIVTSPEKFADALKDWFANGPRVGELKNYPYNNFEEYVQAYSDDITACTQSQKK